MGKACIKVTSVIVSTVIREHTAARVSRILMIRQFTKDDGQFVLWEP